MNVLWIVTMVGAVCGGGIAVLTLVSAKGAPQEASGMAVALAFAVIPYVFTRALEGLVVRGWRKDVLDAIRSGAAPRAN